MTKTKQNETALMLNMLKEWSNWDGQYFNVYLNHFTH